MAKRPSWWRPDMTDLEREEYREYLLGEDDRSDDDHRDNYDDEPENDKEAK
jgi:hypothetical protein